MPLETTSRVLLLLGGFDPEQVHALAATGLVTQTCAGPYDAAAQISRFGNSLRGVCISTTALTPSVVNLVALLRKNFPHISLFLAPNATGRRAELAEKLGLSRWESATLNAPAPAAKIEAIPDVARAAATPATKPAPIMQRPQFPGRHVVRMAPGPRAQPAAPIKADNENPTTPHTSPIEADIPSRYDAEAGDHILTDDELKALLDDSTDPNTPDRP